MPSESTAFLTLRTDVFATQPLASNGKITLSIPGPVTLHLYFNPNPNNDWSNPATFSSGKEIARFNRDANLFISIVPFSTDTFSLDLVFSRPFTISGQEVDFEKLAPNGVTNSNTGTTTPVPGSGNFTLAFPFAGCAIAIGKEGDEKTGESGFPPFGSICLAWCTIEDEREWRQVKASIPHDLELSLDAPKSNVA